MPEAVPSSVVNLRPGPKCQRGGNVHVYFMANDPRLNVRFERVRSHLNACIQFQKKKAGPDGRV